MTSSTIALGLAYAMESNKKVLITHGHFQDQDMEKALLPLSYLRTDLMDLSDNGVDALSRFLRFNKVEEENFKNYTTSILTGKLDLLMGTMHDNKEIYDTQFVNLMSLVLKAAKDYYDMTFIDLPYGDSPISHAILEQADLILTYIPHSVAGVESFKNSEVCKEKRIPIISGYDSNSKYSRHNISRKFKLKEKIYGIPYDITYHDYYQDGKPVEFLLKQYHALKGDMHYPFMDSVKEICKAIDKALQLEA